ncbi:MAG TPA: T9SS type A sorting domain-containing protein, partial [Bacteroidia bacterium]|nr:T9SS type A sorting domain-containing protein [Bacteroidia bacterium]
GGTDSTATGLAPDTYTVTVMDSNGCDFTTAVSVTDTGSLHVTATATNIKCNGSATGTTSANASGGKPPYTYAWAPSGGTNSNATGLTAGTYSITVTDKNSCVSVASATITQPSALAIIKGYVPTYSAIDCNGSAWVKASGGTTPYTYNWSPGGATADSINSLCNGTYCCVITDHNGCIDSVCVSVITGIPILSNSTSIKIFPDPNNGVFTITGLSKGQIVEVYNYTGQEISSTETNSASMQFNITDKANGIYLVRILSADGKPVIQTKILKVN